jgi:diguanylate cyclase (GGDEF)-like protein
MRLLLIEDEPAIAEPLLMALSCLDEAYEISHAATLDRAIQLAEQADFDAALVDLTLPDAANCDVAHALRRTAPELPIVVLTGREFESVGLALARAGAQDYLRKGVDSVQRIHQSLQLAIERQRQKVMLRRKACYDELTGVMNRREIGLQLEKAVSHALRSGQLGAVMLIDVDNFKDINDSFGHHAGDAVLRGLAARMTSTVRSGDSVGRIGGDEFVVVLEGLRDVEQAKHVGEKLLKSCCASLTVNNDVVPITASIGISVFPLDGTTPETLLRLADDAMYCSKRNGKGSVNGAGHSNGTGHS